MAAVRGSVEGGVGLGELGGHGDWIAEVGESGIGELLADVEDMLGRVRCNAWLGHIYKQIWS